MPDQQAPISFIQNSLAAGEVSSNLYGRLDLARVHNSALVMENFFVDYRGGATTRPGTQYIGHPGSAGYARLRQFKFSSQLGQTYMLVFSPGKIRFVKNPGGSSYPNGSNAGFIMSGGTPYEVVTPYAEQDLRTIKFSQLADELTITHRNYERRKLVRHADTNWTLDVIHEAVALGTPTITNGTITIKPSGSTDPEDTRYSYMVAALDIDGNEGSPSAPFIIGPGIDIGVTLGTVSIFWTAVADAAFYRVYKALPTQGNKVPNPSDQHGFCGYSYGTTFLDSNIVPDFSRSPPLNGSPFLPGQITGFTITGSSGDWPVGGTSVVLSGGGSPTKPAIIYPILDNNDAGATGAITSLYIVDPGAGYSSAPTITAAGGGTSFTAILKLGPTTGINPDVVGLFQQRQLYASTNNRPFTIFGSRPGKYDDFRRSNPIIDSDAYSFDIASNFVNKINWFLSMPGGLVIGTDASISQLTGGSPAASNPLAVTPSSAVIVPQSHYGSKDLHPIVIDYDILYVQNEGSIVRDLKYNFFVNIYEGNDVSAFSSQLFYPIEINDWAYQDSPNKVIWCVRGDSSVLSLTWLKSQEIAGWAHHSTNGQVESVDVVQEGTMDAVYFSVFRNGQRCIERQADHTFYMVDDAWCLDSALSTVPLWPDADIALSGASGVQVLSTSAPYFVIGDVGKIVRAIGSKGALTRYISATQMEITIIPGYSFGDLVVGRGSWRVDALVASVSGLDHLNGMSVSALVDGKPQGPFTVSGGTVTLTTPGSAVVVGLPYSCYLQPVMFEPGGEATTQGRRKKFTAATVRVKDSAGLKFGKSRNTVKVFKRGLNSTDPIQDLPLGHPGLDLGDLRIVLDQVFDVLGSMWIVQDQPLPATVLAVIPEVAQGDTR